MKLSQLPSIDRLLGHPAAASLADRHGRARVTAALRREVADLRERIRRGEEADGEPDAILARTGALLAAADARSLKPVLNLTGTILHTNLGRAALPEAALRAVQDIAAGNSNLEFDLDAGSRGDRDTHIERIVTEITGAQAATVVNNNAAAVMLALNTLAAEREVPVSRGELVEIGGSFRIPDIMARSGCRLVEVGATNRTHLGDYAAAIGQKTALLMKVHTSNYAIEGFTASVDERSLATLAHENGLPMMTDLGSGTLVDLETFGLPHEPTAQEALASGADLVTFSGDKLLGGPQAGVIVGRRDLVDRIKANPMKRALRVDKMTLAALHAVLELYRTPEKLVSAVPTLRHLARDRDTVHGIAARLLEPFRAALPDCIVELADTHSQIGSGALPTDLLPSVAVAIRPASASDADLRALAARFRALPVPVLGRIHDGRLLFDVRTLDDEPALARQLEQL